MFLELPRFAKIARFAEIVRFAATVLRTVYTFACLYSAADASKALWVKAVPACFAQCPTTMPIVIHSSLAEVNCEQWNALIDDDYPFLKHEFLLGLELSGCTTPNTGWTPQHIVQTSETAQLESPNASAASVIVAAMPCYAKTHSYGEYIFDWSWADAYYRHGLEYYPKLSNAVPFTPATGPRLLVSETNRDQAYQALLSKAQQLCEEDGYSGWHSLFINEREAEYFESHPDVVVRHSNQFHWRNHDYADFDAFLASLSSKKRKNIKRERRRITEQNIRYTWVTGADLNHEVMQTMYRFYSRTIQMYGAQSYLNRPFFEYLANHFADNTLVLLAHYEDQVIAGGLYFKSDNTLYGRYWGASHNFHSVHFETCYYQAIDWCIQNGYNRFEAGAQGEHKHARGLSPSRTYSAHWLLEPQFHNAIGEFIEQEQKHIAAYQQNIDRHSPYKREV